MAHSSAKATAAQEALIDNLLRSIGLNPTRNPDEAAGTGDRLIDGEATEYKTISDLQNPDSDTISGAIANRAMNARSQAPNVVIDARAQAGMVEADAIRGAVRAFGADTTTALKTGELPKLKSIRVIFLDGSSNATDILIPRHD